MIEEKLNAKKIPTLKRSKSKVARAIIERGEDKPDYKKIKIGIGFILQNQIICRTKIEQGTKERTKAFLRGHKCFRKHLYMVILLHLSKVLSALK